MDQISDYVLLGRDQSDIFSQFIESISYSVENQYDQTNSLVLLVDIPNHTRVEEREKKKGEDPQIS